MTNPEPQEIPYSVRYDLEVDTEKPEQAECPYCEEEDIVIPMGSGYICTKCEYEWGSWEIEWVGKIFPPDPMAQLELKYDGYEEYIEAEQAEEDFGREGEDPMEYLEM